MIKLTTKDGKPNYDEYLIRMLSHLNMSNLYMERYTRGEEEGFNTDLYLKLTYRQLADAFHYLLSMHTFNDLICSSISLCVC